MNPIQTITVGYPWPDGSGDVVQVVVWLIDGPCDRVRPGGTVEMYPD